MSNRGQGAAHYQGSRFSSMVIVGVVVGAESSPVRGDSERVCDMRRDLEGGRGRS